MPPNVNAEDERAVIQAALDYFEGWFAGDRDRMERALHPALAKRALDSDGRSLNETTADWMIDATGRGVGREQSRDDNAIEVTIEDMYAGIASVTVRSAVYREYIHLLRTADGWKIVNTLYART